MPLIPGRTIAGRRLIGLIIVLSGAIVSTGCLHHRRRTTKIPRRPPPIAQPGGKPVPIIQGEEGIASWYGHPYDGRPTASGEIYNMNAMTAAHRTLPFGTRVRVHDLENGRTVTVRINDRGPFVEGRIIDLSHAAAQAMEMPGTALVRLEILGYGSNASPTPPPGTFAVQVGAFQDRRNADRLKSRISRYYGPVNIQRFDRGDGVFYRVRVGNAASEDAANSLARKLRDAGFATETFIVRTD
jgi:rare lipoprotein A